MAIQDFLHGLGPYWQAILDWYLGLPLFGQILVIAGAIAILILSIVLVYYVIKGVAYLVYYILKGTYMLLKAIGAGFYRLCEAIYYEVSGKQRPIKQEEKAEVKEVQVITVKTPVPVPAAAPVQYQAPSATLSFCSECGSEFSESMIDQLGMKGHVFCIHCGAGINSDPLNATS